MIKKIKYILPILFLHLFINNTNSQDKEVCINNFKLRKYLNTFSGSILVDTINPSDNQRQMKIWNDKYVLDLQYDTLNSYNGIITSFLIRKSRNYKIRDTVYFKDKVDSSAVKNCFDFLDNPQLIFKNPTKEYEKDIYGNPIVLNVYVEYNDQNRYVFGMEFQLDSSKNDFKTTFEVLDTLEKLIGYEDRTEYLVSKMRHKGRYYTMNSCWCCGAGQFINEIYSIGYIGSGLMPYGISLGYFKPYFFKKYFPLYLGVDYRFLKRDASYTDINLSKLNLWNIKKYKISGGITFDYLQVKNNSDAITNNLTKYESILNLNKNGVGIGAGIAHTIKSELIFNGLVFNTSYNTRYFNLNIKPSIYKESVDLEINLTGRLFLNQIIPTRIGGMSSAISLSLGYQNIRDYKDIYAKLIYEYN